MNNIIKHWLDVWKEEPLYRELVSKTDERQHTTTLSGSLTELIKISVPQINKCTFCIDYHTQNALKQGEISAI